MTIQQQSFKTWAIILTHFHVAASVTTVIRFAHRRRNARLWWDDYLAIMVVPVDILYLVILWTRYKYGVPGYPTSLRVAFFFLSSFAFSLIVWPCRMSIALSIIRILPAQKNLHRFVYGLTAFFGLSCLAINLMTVLFCGLDTSWHHTAGVQCTGTPWAASFTLDVIGDITLVATPIIALWRLNLPHHQRRLVQIIFSAGLLTVLASTAVYLIIPSSD
ncbi:hypothetical protein VKT23_004793 [Stygiomarasmius scandens]|uniref:Rhodopsin domain-containing protein n=1 Tax=Marasmiellus scandens TaxID=2682957 RepID=A0ABR1JTB0_9AGAR